MDHNVSPDSQFRIPTFVWVLAAGVLMGGIAILVFKVAVGTVLYYGLFGFMMLSHFFMHGSHGSHKNQSDNNTIQNGPGGQQDNQNHQDHKSHSGGCH